LVQSAGRHSRAAAAGQVVRVRVRVRVQWRVTCSDRLAGWHGWHMLDDEHTEGWKVARARLPRRFARVAGAHDGSFPQPPAHQHDARPLPTTAMELDKDNANPTILNPSDLPSRRSDSTAKRRDDGGSGLFDNLIPRYNYLSDPFDDPVSASGSDSDEAPEDIDEQEIYGRRSRWPSIKLTFGSPPRA
jgi:hypothetical protein